MITKNQQMLLEHREADEARLERIKQYTSLEDIEGFEMMHLGRKALKSRLMMRAIAVENEFWIEAYENRHSQPYGNNFNAYGVRVYERTWVVSIQWFKQELYGPRGDKKIFSRSLSLPKNSLKMRKSQFSKAKDWEIELIMTAEEQFEEIRKCMFHLKSMHNAARGLEQLLARQ